MGFFDKVSQGGKMVKAANKVRQIQNALSKERISHEGKGVKVVLAGGIIPKVKTVQIDGVEVESRVVDALNKAYEEAQKVMAKKMQEMGGGLTGLF